MTSMLEQERAEALDLVVDAILAERPPIDAGVDREHGLVEPERGVDSAGKFARMSHSCRVQRASARPVRTAALYPSTCAESLPRESRPMLTRYGVGSPS